MGSVCFNSYLLHSNNHPDLLLRKNCLCFNQENRFKVRLQWIQRHIRVARTNMIKTFVTVGLCFVICWSNNQIYYLMYNLGYKVDWNSTYYNATVFMVFLNCTVNPFIYLIKYRDYQKALRHLLCRKKLDSHNVSITSVTSGVSSQSR